MTDLVTMEGVVHTEIAGERVILLPQKAMYIPATHTLVLADVHIGKAASFRSRNFFAPDGISSFDLFRLSQLIKQFAVTRLIVLGDLVHSQDGMTSSEVELFERFRDAHLEVNVVLILGNHDRKVRLPPSWNLDLIHGHMAEGPFVYSHDLVKTRVGYVLCGHVHPSVVLHGQGKQRLRLPCFWLRPKYAVLPAFGVFTGTYSIEPTRTDRVFVVARDTVVAIETEKLKGATKNNEHNL